MKKAAAFVSASIGYLLTYATVLAQTDTSSSVVRNTKVTLGKFGVNPAERSVGDVISNALTIVFIAAALAVLVFLIIGAFRWITSSGDKEAIGKARGTIVNALVGLAILALAFFITVLFGQILNINILDLPQLPTLNQQPTTSTN